MENSPDLTGGREVGFSTEPSPSSRRSQPSIEGPSCCVPDWGNRPRSEDLLAVRVEGKAVVCVLLLAEINLSVLPGVAVVEGWLLHPVCPLRHLPHRPDHRHRSLLRNLEVAASLIFTRINDNTTSPAIQAATWQQNQGLLFLIIC